MKRIFLKAIFSLFIFMLVFSSCSKDSPAESVTISHPIVGKWTRSYTREDSDGEIYTYKIIWNLYSDGTSLEVTQKVKNNEIYETSEIRSRYSVHEGILNIEYEYTDFVCYFLIEENELILFTITYDAYMDRSDLHVWASYKRA